MDNVKKRIDIDFYSPTAYEVIKAQQGDNNSRIIEFVLYNHGKPYTISNNISVKMEGHRGDNSSFIKDCTIADNIITVALDSDILYEAGTVEAKIVMYDLSNNNILSTIPFKIHVQKNPCDKNKIEKGKKSLIDWLILNFEKIKENLFKHLEDKNNPHEVTKAQVGLENVDNTSDLNKPVSTAQQAALDKKANIESPILTGAPQVPTASADNDSTQIATTAFTQTAIRNHNTSSTAHSDIRNLISGLNTRLNALADSDDTTLDQLSEIVAYIKSNRSLIENVTTNKVNVSDIIDNLTSTATNKPLSANQGKILNDLINTLTATVSNKVDKVEGKGLSTNDYTDEEKNKVASIFGGTVTGVKGNSESEYRNGNVNITPNNIGALSTTGGTVTGRTEFTKGTYVHNFTNANSRDIFVKVCTIKIKQGWADSPIMFDVIGRVYDGGSIYVKFQSNQGNDPGLAAFCYSGILYGTPYIHNSNTSTWDIYLNCRPYDSISITSIKMNNYQYSKTEITWTSEFVDSVPTSSIEATLMEYNITASESKIAAKLGRDGDMTIPMTFYWKGKSEQPTWLWGGHDGSNMYVYSPSNITCGKATSDASGNPIANTYALKQMFTSDNNGTRILNPDGSGFLWHTYSNQIYLGTWTDVEGVKGFGGIVFTAYGKGAGMCQFYPYTNNTTSLGESTNKWKEIYAATSTIITSDKNEKKDIENLDDDQIINFIMGLKPKSYKFINNDSNRTHTGLIAQDVEELLEQLGMSTLDFAGFIKSPKIKTVDKEIEQKVEKNGEIVIEKSTVSEEEIIEGEYIYGLRYEEFISPLIKMVQIQQEKINELVNANENLMKKIETFKSTLEEIKSKIN